jgi:hypothetical protein
MNMQEAAGMDDSAVKKTTAAGEVFSESLTEKTYNELVHMLTSLKFGSVTLIVQNGKVIQIEKNEKLRLV